MNNELIMQLQGRYSELQESEERLNLVEQQISELQAFGESIKEINNSDDCDILAPLGKGVYLPAQIKEKNLFVGVGSGIFVKKTPDEAEKVVVGQVSGLIKMREEFSLRIEKLNVEMREMMGKIEQSESK